MSRILVVDDEPQMLRALHINLKAHGHHVEIAIDGTAALRQAGSTKPELVVLDLGLPDMDGVDVIRGLRGWTEVPIIVLSGRAGSQDKVLALDAGADDYITKPFSVEELLARIRAVARRRGASDTSPVVRIGNYDVDLVDHAVRGPKDVHLTPTEWQLLEILLRNPGKLITQRQLLTQVWGPNYEQETNYLRQYFAQLRRKLEDNPSRPRHLLTEPGIGYRFQPGRTR